MREYVIFDLEATCREDEEEKGADADDVGADLHHKLGRMPYIWPWRRPRTTQERRHAASDEHKPFVRAKRNPRNLANHYDDVPPTFQRTWKEHSKARHQWLAAQNQHVDTATVADEKRGEL